MVWVHATDTTEATVTTKFTAPQQAAMDLLTGQLDGRLHSGSGVRLTTARALARQGLAWLEEHSAASTWTLVLIEPETQEITDAELHALPSAEADLLRPLDTRRRYRALRHAHIAFSGYGPGAPLGTNYGARTRAETLGQVISLMLAWAESNGRDTTFNDLAGRQWKSARNHVLDVWEVVSGSGNAVFLVDASTREEAQVLAQNRIAGEPTAFPQLSRGYGFRRQTLGKYVADQRSGRWS
jgi:hypothetical protein